MAKFKINGREIEADSKEVVIKAAIDNGIFIPHFCWHPGLSPEGNCRMCLVKTSTSRKLEPACMMRCQDNIVVETETPEVQKARKDVLEFLLINHPLD
jgi:NADH-quinone oxidoreductase subunit G